MVQVFVRNLASRSVAYNVETSSSVIDLKNQIEDKEGIPSTSQGLVFAGRQLDDVRGLVADYGVQAGNTLHLLLRLRGGKGGFGALLRGQGRDGKLTTNFDACRDLQGRRIRHQRTEEELREWQRQSKERELEKLAQKHIRELARQQRAEAKEQVDMLEYTEAHKKAIGSVQDAVNDALKHNSTGETSNGKRKPEPAATEPPAKVVKKSKMLAALEDITDSDSDSE